MIHDLAGKKIVIIGGGAAGVSAAAYALQNGFRNVTLLESTATLGGLHKDIEINGLHFDLGAFFFWQHHNILKLFPDLKDMLVYAESSNHFSLTNQGSLDHYPLTLKTYIKENGYVNTACDLFLLFVGRLSKPLSSRNNVSEIMTYYMGPFFRKTGLHFYIKRLYGIDPELLDREFAYQRMSGVISKFSVSNMIRALSKGNLGYFKKYEILLETWARPEGGFETMYRLIHNKLVEMKCTIHFNESVTKIDLAEKNIRTSTGRVIPFDYLFSSQPLMSAASMSGTQLDIDLKYRPLYSLFYEVPEQIMNNCFVLFNFTQRGRWKRVTFHSNYYNRNKTGNDSHRHYFVVESMPVDIELSTQDIVNQLDLDFRHSFTGTLWDDSFKGAKLLGHHLTKNAYPVYDLSFDRNKINDFKEKMQLSGVYMVGRQGQFVHNSSSDASRSSILAIQDIIEKNRDQIFNPPNVSEEISRSEFTPAIENNLVS